MATNKSADPQSSIQKTEQVPQSLELSKTDQQVPAPYVEVQAEAPKSTPVTKEAQADAGMPPMVSAYLVHLNRIEQMRQDMGRKEASQLNNLMSIMQGGNQADASDPNSTSNGSEKTRMATDATGQVESAWNQLLSQFKSVNPPQECSALAMSYGTLLTETINMMTQIQNTVNSASGDPQGALSQLQAMQGTSTKLDMLARTSENSLASIYAQYNQPQAFHIAQDIGK